MEFLHWFNPASIIDSGGIWVLLLIVFIETGIFFGFFLPGDSLLFTAGLMCSLKVLDIPLHLLLVSLIIASIAGTWVGYLSGKYFLAKTKGRKGLFSFKKRYLFKTCRFYHKYGETAMVVGKFFPIVRTFLPILAGLLRIKGRRFFLLNAAGSLLWVTSMVALGYYLGNFFPWLINYLWIIIPALIVITMIPLTPSILHSRISQ